LLGLARDKSVEGRTRLVQIVGDLFFDTDTILRESERSIVSDILRQLIHNVEMKVRQVLAERMASESDAPHDRIKLETAKKVVEHWRLDPDFLFALKQLNAKQTEASG
jgi:uncharacterized protein (DUF2336 family)